MELVGPTFGIVSLLLMLVFMAAPLVVLAYIMWLLTRLTRAVERIELHLSGEGPLRGRHNEDR